jgi:hypothetical protein
MISFSELRSKPGTPVKMTVRDPRYILGEA